ncbi:hypothetical protein DL93DRAFT_2086652 [Clavulina sp. PMI_390]|nr:hypothetical protein DL93DRAFT_2086652 [Clavulina sp. PMI_390]
MIGPSIPTHLRGTEDSEEDEDDGPQPLLQPRSESENPSVTTLPSSTSIGPQLPPSVKTAPQPSPYPAADEEDDDDDDDSYAPALPPGFAPAAASSSARVIGPSIPTASDITAITKSSRAYDPDEDDDYGPMPMPAGPGGPSTNSGVRQFIEREEKRAKELEESLKPKALKRDEWMLAPPTDSGLLGSLDPTKLKSRQFSRSTEEKSKVSTLWTETPAERQQRLADETMGKRKRAEISAGANAAEEETEEQRKRRRHDAEISRGIEEHTKKRRGAALIDSHQANVPSDAVSTSSTSRDLQANSQAIWDRDRDMSLGGRLMDDKARGKLISDAKNLGSRFSAAGKGGRYL